MTITALICGSLAFDKIMQYHGRFGDTLLAVIAAGLAVTAVTVAAQRVIE